MDNYKDRNEFIEKLCTSTWKELYRFIYYKVQNREEAQDITQETYAKAINHLIKNDTSVNERTAYLKSIALNIIRDQWRVKKRKGSYINIDEVNQEKLMSEDFTELLASKDEIAQAMARLSSDQQMVITLRIIKGYSVTDTALYMNKKESTVRVLQFRALKELAKLLNPGL